jgi:effector-binding domain-containing protein
VDHQGPFGTVVSAYDALDLHFAANRLTPRMPVVEEYLTDPSKEPDPSKWLTRVVFFAE